MDWVPLPHYQGHEINILGEVRNVQTGQIMKTSVNQSGVRYVSIRNTTLNKYENKTIGVLVAETFINGRTANEETVLHLDGNTENNAADNLMWATRWHAMAYHKEIEEARRNLTGRRHAVQDVSTGAVYRDVVEAAMATGCLPSQIDYGMRYNDNMASNEHVNFAHTTYPGSHIFRSA